jgi:hypothetical protein
MNRLLTVAAVVAGLLLALPFYAQSRGGGHSMGAAPARGGGSSSFRAGPGPVRSASPMRAPITRPAPSGSSSYWRHGPVGGFNGHRPYFPNHGYYGWPGYRTYFSYPLYPYWYPLFGDDSSSYQQAPSALAPTPEQDSGSSDQVAELTNQVQMLQEEQAAREYLRPPAAETRARAQEKPLSTVLVYRDGHQLEVQDYALMGNTVWVLGDQTTRKIPLADLDLDVTQKLNADRGVDFVTPATR